MFQVGGNEEKGAKLVLVVPSDRRDKGHLLEFREFCMCRRKDVHSEGEGTADCGVCVPGDVENPAECGGPEQPDSVLSRVVGLGNLQRSFPNSEIKEFE